MRRRNFLVQNRAAGSGPPSWGPSEFRNWKCRLKSGLPDRVLKPGSTGIRTEAEDGPSEQKITGGLVDLCSRATVSETP